MSRTPRFFEESLPGEPGLELELSTENVHHARNVLRLRAGDPIEVFDGRGGAGHFDLSGDRKGPLRAILTRRTDDDREARARIVLAFAPPQPKRTLALIEKATELGVARLVPLETTRTRVALPERALDKLRRRAIEAAKQCGRNRLPEIASSVTLAGLVEREGAVDLRLLPDTGDCRGLKEELRGRPSLPSSAVYAIGPEGGFDDDERSFLASRGFVRVRLGGATLRVETAAIAVLTCLRYELG